MQFYSTDICNYTIYISTWRYAELKSKRILKSTLDSKLLICKSHNFIGPYIIF